MTEVEAQQAVAITTAFRQALERWRGNYDDRDPLVRNANTAGISRREIHEITGLARSTINRILSSEEQQR